MAGSWKCKTATRNKMIQTEGVICKFCLVNSILTRHTPSPLSKRFKVLKLNKLYLFSDCVFVSVSTCIYLYCCLPYTLEIGSITEPGAGCVLAGLVTSTPLWSLPSLPLCGPLSHIRLFMCVTARI